MRPSWTLRSRQQAAAVYARRATGIGCPEAQASRCSSSWATYRSAGIQCVHALNEVSSVRPTTARRKVGMGVMALGVELCIQLGVGLLPCSLPLSGFLIRKLAQEYQ